MIHDELIRRDSRRDSIRLRTDPLLTTLLPPLPPSNHDRHNSHQQQLSRRHSHVHVSSQSVIASLAASRLPTSCSQLFSHVACAQHPSRCFLYYRTYSGRTIHTQTHELYCVHASYTLDYNNSTRRDKSTHPPSHHIDTALVHTRKRYNTNMASIFTFDPDPPRVSSPWTIPPNGDPARSLTPHKDSKPIPSKLGSKPYQGGTDPGIHVPDVDCTNITRLEAEPQEGPTEYKLHLLLRRRRSFTRASTGRWMSGSMRRSDIPISASTGRSVSESGLLPNTPPPLASTQSKQHRLEQLTTQLLWRLQQSCPYHISSSTAPVVPHFPDDARLSTPEMPQRLLPGLEESKGALYEIGVADDGTIVGLAEDEMEESLNNLRAMAASLGCGVQVLRRVSVGECEWLEDSGTSQQTVQTSRLLVAEALVRPDQHLIDHTRRIQQTDQNAEANLTGTEDLVKASINESQTTTEQLRVSVTGATMSGKSSLLGTLSTATLDNGRGKSRLSLLKHRHEIASGMTSSVTQELIGYRDVMDDETTTTATQVVSYGSGDVSSWIDIHASVDATEHGRLVFLSDSAGHPRFRRTTVRGIVGW